MKRIIIYAIILSSIVTSCHYSGPEYLNEDAPIEERIQDALKRMSIEEKVAIIHAQSKFSSAGVPRLGIPEIWTTDGPHGIRPEVKWDEWDQAGWTNDSIVAFPALTCLAATWNRNLSSEYGKAIGEEARYRDKDVLLGPGVNIARTPLNGRNFEYMGEDPYLAAQMVVPYIKGVQSNGVAACVKHFALNNEETHRHTIDVDLDDRALYEIYLPAFKAACTEGGAWAIMSSYNKFRGKYVSSETILTRQILRDEWGWDGAVISDWGAVHETENTVSGGLDLEFGSWTNGLTEGYSNAYDSYHLAQPFLKGLKDSIYDEKYLDEKVTNVLRLNFRTAMNTKKPYGSRCTPEHYAVARKVGAEGMVLLKNSNSVLPIKNGCSKILVVGENAIKMMTVGGGSSSLKAQYEVSPLQGIIERAAADNISVEYQRGYVGDNGGSYNGVTTGQDLNDSRTAEELLKEAVDAAASADYVIFVGGLNKSDHQDCEGTDRLGLDLPYGQNELITALTAVNPNTVVILVSGNPVSMPWCNDVPAILEAWYCGSEAGNSLAGILFGDYNPSGKLPFTFPVHLEDSPAHQKGLSFPNDGPCYYNEGIFVGYRWFDKHDIKPLFAFGHGLSYTDFEFSDCKVRKTLNGNIKVNVTVTNIGDRSGSEVVQVYVTDPVCSVERPEKELKGFEKVGLEPGQSKKVTITIKKEDLCFFDSENHKWEYECGEFIINVGNSSDNILFRRACK